MSEEFNMQIPISVYIYISAETNSIFVRERQRFEPYIININQSAVNVEVPCAITVPLTDHGAVISPKFGGEKISGRSCIRVPYLGYRSIGTYKVQRYEIPPNYDKVEFPERRKLKYFERVPNLPGNQRPQKMMKELGDMRGPELIHNKIQYGEYAVQALCGGQLRWGHLEGSRLVINRKMDERRMFAVWRIDQPWKAITKKGQGHRMGSGKGSIDHYTTPIKARRMIVEMGGHCELKEVWHILSHVAHILPFRARVVTKQMLEEEEAEEKYIEENNINPFTFQYCVKHNLMGVRKYLSPYDTIWHGKYR